MVEHTDKAPFLAEHELCHSLSVSPDGVKTVRLRESNRESSSTETDENKGEKDYLPGQPRISLSDPDIGSYLESEFVTSDLDKLAPYLWLVATADSSHISPLTHQVVRGREIIVTENVRLHLVWIYDRIFIKPIPKYLLSHAFWEFYLLGRQSPISTQLRQDIAKSALGFLRSYLHLIHHKSDFLLATDDKLRLIAKDIHYADFAKFILSFQHIDDSVVSPRYKFGELRLTRLNLWSRIVLRRFTYQKVHGQYGAYFAQFYGPLLFYFAAVSVVLSSMQVATQVLSLIPPGQSWVTFSLVSRGFAVCTLVSVAGVLLFLFFVWVSLILREVIFTVKQLRNRRVSKTDVDAEQSIPTG